MSGERIRGIDTRTNSSHPVRDDPNYEGMRQKSDTVVYQAEARITPPYKVARSQCLDGADVCGAWSRPLAPAVCLTLEVS